MREAVARYVDEVRSRSFPTDQQSAALDPSVLAALRGGDGHVGAALAQPGHSESGATSDEVPQPTGAKRRARRPVTSRATGATGATGTNGVGEAPRGYGLTDQEP